MAGEKLTVSKPPRPPAVAEWFLALFAGRVDRASILGDLQEEYTDKYSRESFAATHWYWRQIAIAVPHLAMERARKAGLPIGTAILSLGAYAAIALWEVYVSAPFAERLRADNAGLPLFALRNIYLLVQLIGVTLCASAIAHFTFTPATPFYRNFLLRLGPLAALLIATEVVLGMASMETIPYRIVRLLASGLALVIGAQVFLACAATAATATGRTNSR